MPTKNQCDSNTTARKDYLTVVGVSLVVASLTAEASEMLRGCNPFTLDDVARLNPPGFEQYPAKHAPGEPHEVDIASHPIARRYRTMLRMQAPKGPDFAGHYTVASWGCGSACLQFAIIDAITGKVYFPPHIESVSTVHVSETASEAYPTFNALRYRVDSRLLIILGAPNEDEAREGIAYYEWTGKALKLLRLIKSEKVNCTE